MENYLLRKLLSVFLLSGFGLCSVEYCRHHTFDNGTSRNFLQFSKENSEREFGIIGGYKSVHCCSHGYRSIEWFKDGKPYPWPTDVSTLIISPESGNQTIYSQSISEMDSGGYWCIVRNDTDFLRHDVLLKVAGSSDLEDPPRPTYKPRKQVAALGENARFYCEAFVGNISLPDARSEISWKKLNVNNSVLNNDRIKQQIVSREGNQVLGSYLFISDVRKEDYGEYVCRVSNTGDQILVLNASLIEEDKTVRVSHSSYPSGGTILLVFLLILSASLSTITLVHYRSHFMIIIRRLFQKSYSRRPKEYDVLVIYHASDKHIALNKIVFTLQNSYHYVCYVYPITMGKLDCKDLKQKARRSKRVLALISSGLTENDWSYGKVNFILQNLISIHPRIIAVFLETVIMNESEEQAAALKTLSQRVYCIKYNEKETRTFWDSITLGLPVSSVGPITRENVELV